jgi:Domain of unknown function (DUF1905)
MHIGENPWYFITLPHDEADEIDEITTGKQRGFGSVRVEVTVGHTTWHTSIFPDSKRGSYVLPIKKQVRIGENWEVGATKEIVLTLADVSSPTNQ